MGGAGSNASARPSDEIAWLTAVINLVLASVVFPLCVYNGLQM